MIHLDKKSMFGKGHHRECYPHPDDANLCIKIIVDGSHDSNQAQRELKYYKHLKRRGISWDMLSGYHGDIMTNMGIGSVYDLIKDHDGSVSKTFGYYIASNEIAEANYEDLLKTLYALKQYLLKEGIITLTLAHRNIVCQKNDTGIFRMHVIDNIGNGDFIPLASHINFLARIKIERRWKRFEAKLLKEYPENEALHQILSSIRGKG